MKLKDGYLLRNVAGQWVVVPVGNRIHDFNGLMTLNETGSFIWRAIKDGKDREQIIMAMIEEYDIDGEAAQADFEEFIDTLVDGGVLEK